MNDDDAMMHDAKLQERARRLGAGAAERLDVERTAAAVVARLRAEARPARWRWMRPAWLRIAAAAVLLLGAGLVTRAVLDGSGGGGHAGAGHYVAEDLSGLSETELQQLLATLDETLDLSAPPSSEPGLEQLTEEQLQTMLRSLGGEG